MWESFVKGLISPEAFLILTVINAIPLGAGLVEHNLVAILVAALSTVFSAFMCRHTWREHP